MRTTFILSSKALALVSCISAGALAAQPIQPATPSISSLAGVIAPVTGSEALALGTVTWSADFPGGQASLAGMSPVAQLSMERVGADATNAVTGAVAVRPVAMSSAADFQDIVAEQAETELDPLVGVAPEELANRSS